MGTEGAHGCAGLSPEGLFPVLPPSGNDPSRSHYYKKCFWIRFGSAATWGQPRCGKCSPVPRAALDSKRALTVVLINESVADFIRRDLPVGFCGLSPAQLRHSGRDDVESQAARLTGHWKGKDEVLRLLQLGVFMCSELPELQAQGCQLALMWGKRGAEHSPSSSVRQWMMSE